ncbi:MAG: class I SAM-dependent methyltransferase [Deltaproteobacteria bacterium]|nr:class I SAM-dependent methyltransferase [Deltaproteobacteria bacterium]
MSARAGSLRSLYTDPAYYSMLFDGRESDVAFYAHLAARASSDSIQGLSRPVSVLEYGVGAGRIGIPLARAGYEVFGVDTSPEMLRALAERASNESRDVQSRLAWCEGDAREVSLGRVFDLVLCPFNGIAHHHGRHELRAFLVRVREHLAPDGVFAFDVWLPNPTLLSGGSTCSPVFFHPRTNEPVRCTETFEYDPFSQVLTTRVSIAPAARAGEPEVLTLRVRQLFPEETMLLLESHGFEVVWRTSRFAPPLDDSGGGLETEGEDERGEMIAYVCRLR